MNTLELWKTYSRIPSEKKKGVHPGFGYGYQHLLYLLGVPKEQLDEMVRLDVEELEVISKEEKYYNEVMKPQGSISRAEWMEEEKEFLKESRIEFLTNEIKKYEAFFDSYEEARKGYDRKGYNLVMKVFLDETIWKGSKIDIQQKYLKRLKSELDFRKQDGIIGEGGVTVEQVEQARRYPFEQLIEFDRRGFVKCFYHNERTASMSLDKKTNMIHCFGCDKSADTIQYIMDKNQKSFIEAVKQLC
jgi:transcription elongation factor Elf1